MQIRVRYFAALRESLGTEEIVCLIDGDATVGALRDMLIARSLAHAQALSRQRAVRCAVDQRMADDATLLRAGVEVAFFPPVTGG
jgi:molybdopterin synthase sulfur carrier subunit